MTLQTIELELRISLRAIEVMNHVEPGPSTNRLAACSSHEEINTIRVLTREVANKIQALYARFNEEAM